MQNLIESASQTELFEKLAAYRCDPPLQVRVVVAGSQEPLRILAEKRSPFPLRTKQVGDFAVGLFNYGTGDVRFSGTIFFCESGYKNISYLICICSGAVWHRSILRLVKALYPKLVPVFFTQSELVELLKQARSVFPGAEFRVVGHSRKQSLKVAARRQFESSRTRTEKPLEAVFSEAVEQGYWFSSVSFEARREADGPRKIPALRTSGTLSKYGHFFSTSNFDQYLYTVVSQMAAIAEKRMKFYSNRSRRITKASEPRPISITFDTAEFVSQTDTNKFVGVMKKMAGVSCSVLHDNPYVHLSVVDSADGSAADVWVLKNDEVLLVPQLQASEAALKKFVNYIFEEWREGSVSSPNPAHGIQP